jgi:RNA-directed DNA polymerase
MKGYYRAAQGKSDRDSVANFHSRLETNVLKMREELDQGVYHWGEYRAFWVVAPKLRKIESAPFRDRVVHQAMAEVLEPLFDPAFFHHSYACRSGRGTHRAMNAVHKWISARPESFYLQMDVAKYFPSINRSVLYEIVEKRIGDPRFLFLVRSLLNSSPGENGIPIGNLTSQLFANLYLDQLDQFIKRTLRVKYYVRYMDDIVLIHENYSQLKSWRREIDQFAAEKLRLRFHPHKTALAPARTGISFVGYRILPDCIRVRNNAVRRFRKGAREKLPLDSKVRRLISYQGHILHATGHRNLMASLRNIAFSQEGFAEM